jgi:alpha-galactosidase
MLQPSARRGGRPAACNVGCGNYSFPNEDFVAKTAEAMVKLGLKDAGWGYVNLDDGWAAVQRSAAGRQVAVPRKFPGGMAALAAKVHVSHGRRWSHSDAT